MEWKLFSAKHIFLSLVLFMDTFIKFSQQKTIVTPTPWNFDCGEDVGAFPHSTDCQRFWVCREPFSNINMIEDGTGRFSNSRVEPHLFKCPDGYLFDIKIRFCQQEEIATCSILTTTSTTTTSERPDNRDIGLFGLLFGLP